ncbi:site-specific integrase [Alkaliphilus sp. B6464]|uniref:site-specific integrase n=1 Tax=Alkaliphilus sp. B6464 TaxID=2731219 RepID=UPI001BA73448|nr:site-specific integrase [Alkaliphilus sp. B6464]QUH19432.1 phage integrase N-terminal SAM-like domain-containing protein [Alkaliphilus sp. B6464]
MELFLDEYELGVLSVFVFRLKSDTAARDYKREINNFKKFISKDIVSATDQDVNNYLEFLKKEGKAATIIRRIYSQLLVSLQIYLCLLALKYKYL